jgi:predicted amidohydrolase
MQLVGVQLDFAWEDREANHAKVRRMLATSPPKSGALVALPEMFASGFSMNVERIADDATRASETFLCEIAKRFHVTMIGGLATCGPVAQSTGLARNEAVVAGSDGSVVARYSKIHPYSPGKEAQHYGGGRAIVTFKWSDFTVAPFVCYDLRFPEIFRAGMQRGADVMVVIANWPSPRVEHWITLLRARAIENQSFVMGVNRCGNDPYLPYPGRSLIVAPNGSILADAGDRESIITAEIEPATVRDYRRELPFLADAKTDVSRLFD